MSARMQIAREYEKALFEGRMEDVGRFFTDDIRYWVAGRAPIGGEWLGRAAVLRAFTGREFGLGAADWGYEDVDRTWFDADERVVVEIRERSRLRSAATPPGRRARPRRARSCGSCSALRRAGRC